MPTCITCQEQSIAGEAFERPLRGKQSSVILNRAGIFEFSGQLGKIMDNAVKVGTRIIIAVRVQHTYPQADTTVSTWEGPGIATRCKFAAHDQVEFILGIVRGI